MKEKKTDSEIAATLGIDSTRRSRFGSARWLFPGIAVLAVLAFIIVTRSANDAAQVRYKTEEVRRGNLVVTVSATGNLEPTNQVDVSSELSGIVDSVRVDYNDKVEAGQVLAELNTDKLKAQVLQSQAALAAAEAKVRETKASVRETQLKLQRCQRLAANKLCAEEEVDSGRAASLRAQAEQGLAEAQVAQARAKLEADRTDLGKTVIYSPIKGVVLVRAVEPGQTVASSLQAPVMFTLAEDLSQMELHVDVDEADVGQVADGQTATFAVDAFPDRTFTALITQVRYGAQEVDGVITYETVLKVDNSDLSLRPGMTATAEIVVEEISDAVLVPNAALRFKPRVQAAKSTPNGGSLFGRLMPRPPAIKKNPTADASDKGQQRVWVMRDGTPVAQPVNTGASDGMWTEIRGGELQPGAVVAVETIRSD
jgi:HlyD family secretion protein